MIHGIRGFHPITLVSGYFFLLKLRDAATSLAHGLRGGAFDVQEEAAAIVEDDLEAGPEVEKTDVLIFLNDNFNRAVRKSICEKALVIMPTFPATFCFILPGLLCLAQIRWQLAPLGFPTPTLHKWYIVCVSSLLIEFVASIVQWIISAAGGL